MARSPEQTTVTDGADPAVAFAGALSVTRGVPHPLGARRRATGVNFALMSRRAEAVELVLFAGPGEPVLAAVTLAPSVHRTGHVWHAALEGLPEAFCYAYRVRRAGGTSSIALLLDPYATGVTGHPAFGPAGSRGAGGAAVRTGYLADDGFDWEDDRAPRVPWSDTVIYELSVRGFTRHSSAGVAAPGTFAGLMEKIPYLVDLGVSAVELLPVTDFEEDDCDRVDASTGARLFNLWGYQPLSFMALKPAFAADPRQHGPAREFKQLVKAMHAAGIEVFLDVVFNHTGEADRGRPTYSWRGIDERSYYLHDPASGDYLDFTGCGNTLNCNHPASADLIIESLRWMVSEYRVDGFRFDLASVLCRGPDGAVLDRPPLLDRITSDAVLADAKLIAEPWDASGFYQVGQFPGNGRFAQWNDRFRDDLRQFLRGDPGCSEAAASRLTGSADLFDGPLGRPWQSINYLACHDGFTLRDLFSYSHKHNLRNGEQGRDGTDANWSWNCGVEGDTEDPEVLRLRARLARNAFVLLLLASGTPMLQAGDEFGRTQRGNNNGYCQDNALGWVDWEGLDGAADLHRFVRALIRFRRAHPALRSTRFGPAEGQPTVRWHGVAVAIPDWAHHSRTIAMEVSAGQRERLYLIANAFWEPLAFNLPEPLAGGWCRVVDTHLEAPADITLPPHAERLADGATYQVGARSTVVLFSARGG